MCVRVRACVPACVRACVCDLSNYVTHFNLLNVCSHHPNESVNKLSHNEHLLNGENGHIV